MAEAANGFTIEKDKRKRERKKQCVLTSALKNKKGKYRYGALHKSGISPMQECNSCLVLYAQQFYFKNQGSTRTDIGRTIIAIG
jgi:hypothetical protein